MGQLINILLVDPDVDDVERTRQSFELAGLPADVTVAASAEEALMRLRRIGPHANAARPDVMLSHFALPGMSGIDLLRDVRAADQTKKLPVIMFAGSASSEEREKAETLGADHVLDAPEDDSGILGVVAAIKFFWMARAASEVPPEGSVRPIRNSSIDLMTLPLEPREAFLISAIDGELGVDDLSALIGASAKETRGMLRRLAELGAVQWDRIHPSLMPPAAAIPAPSLMPPPQSTYVPRSPFSIAPGRPVRAAQPPPAPPPAVAAVLPLAPITPEPPPAVAAVPPLAPITAEPPPAVATLQSPPTSDKPLLDPGSQLVIDQTYELLGENNHYELLGVATDATKEEIRSAYYRLAKLFHPDSRYTWDLGPYQRKMERIFQGLTDAYATLGKKKSRQAYDDYLGIVVRTAPLERALSMPRMEAVKPAARAEAPRAEPDPETEPVASRQRTDPVRREHPRTSSAAVTSEASGPRRVARAAQAKGAVKALARTLNQMSGRTVGIDRATRLITDAKTAEREGNLAGAANAMRIAAQWRPHDQELAREADRLAQAALEANVGQYEQRAGYEERNSMWNEAALSWSRVAKARPQDSAPARRAASMIVKSAGDMREAMRLARHAVDMDPRCVDSRIVLGEVYLATGMKASAQAQLKAAVEIEPTHARAKAMLAELRTRAGRT